MPPIALHIGVPAVGKGEYTTTEMENATLRDLVALHQHRRCSQVERSPTQRLELRSSCDATRTPLASFKDESLRDPLVGRDVPCCAQRMRRWRFGQFEGHPDGACQPGLDQDC